MAGSERLDDTRLLDAFASYARRQLGEAGPAVVQLGPDEPLRAVPREAGLVVVAGERGRLSEGWFAKRSGLHAGWRGVARASASSPGVPFTLWDRWDPATVGPTPARFDVLAVVTAYNESDIIEQLLDRLIDGGVRVHVIENWSTDGTEKLVGSYLDTGRVTMERFPPDGPTPFFELGALLGRVAEVTHRSGADWVIHHDADEIHESVWPQRTLRDGLWALDRWGFNCVDHSAIDFRPVDDSWLPGQDLASSFDWFEFGTDPGHFTLLKAWKPQAVPVTGADGGHAVDFPGRRIFPYKFPIRHYSLRSPAHAERKLFQERRNRWSPEERARGWHVHYDHFDEQSTFLWDPARLHRWSTVDDELLLQRLSGVGLPNNPRPDEAAIPPSNMERAAGSAG